MRPCLLLLLAACVTSVAAAQAETVTFKAGRYADFRQIASGEASVGTLTLTGTLSFPDALQDRPPAVVIVHTIAGYQESNEGWHAAQFRKAGFATLTYDSPTARTMRQGSSHGSKGGPPWASAVAEAYAALRLLADDPRLDRGRIAIVGFSFGGEVAHLTAFERLRIALVPSEMRFAAHVAYYPAGVFGLTSQQAYTGAPVLMLLGEKDDNLPIAKSETYLAYARGPGRSLPINVSIHPGAHHAWTVPGLGSPRFYPQYDSTRQCPYILLGSAPPELLVDGQAKSLEPGILQTCLKEGRGYTMAYDALGRARSTRETLEFLRQLRP